MATEGKTVKVSKGKVADMGDFQLKIIGEVSTEKLSKKESERFKGGQWLCNCTCRLARSLTTRYSFSTYILETLITIIALFEKIVIRTLLVIEPSNIFF